MINNIIIPQKNEGVQIIMELVEVRNNQAVVSSVQVAESFGKQHRNVLQSINEIKKQYKKDNSSAEFSAQYHETTYKDASGKNNKMYLMNRDGFSLLVMGFTGEKAFTWKRKYIKAFNKMEKALNKQIAVREASKIARRNLTDTIRDEIPDSPHKKFKYKHFTDLVYTLAIGCTAKQFRQAHGLDKDANIRDYLSTDQIKTVDKYESLVKDLIRMGWEYEQVKNFLKSQLALTA